MRHGADLVLFLMNLIPDRSDYRQIFTARRWKSWTNDSDLWRPAQAIICARRFNAQIATAKTFDEEIWWIKPSSVYVFGRRSMLFGLTQVTPSKITYANAKQLS